MLSRSANVTASFSGRASSMRRLRRRSASAAHVYCSTNGCTTFLVIDPATGIATCPVCGSRRRLS